MRSSPESSAKIAIPRDADAVITEVAIVGWISHIETHRTEVEAEYQQVLQEAEELRKYYEEQNRDRVARSAAKLCEKRAPRSHCL